jgi:hypothetical protein
MIKYLKFLWKKCFGSVGYSRTETEVEEVVQHTSTDLPIILVKPKPLHCTVHTRFKKSCVACAEVTK